MASSNVNQVLDKKLCTLKNTYELEPAALNGLVDSLEQNCNKSRRLEGVNQIFSQIFQGGGESNA